MCVRKCCWGKKCGEKFKKKEKKERENSLRKNVEIFIDYWKRKPKILIMFIFFLM